MPKPPGRLQQQRQGRLIRQWQVVMICPSRELNVGDSIPVQEFVERRLVWIERLSERRPPTAPPLPRALVMLLMQENQRPACSEEIRRQAEAAALSLRQLQRRCGSLSSAPQTPASRPFPLGEVETLAEARLDVQGPEELHAGLRPWNDGARIGLLPWSASRLHQGTIPEICAMGDITVDDFTGSVV